MLLFYVNLVFIVALNPYIRFLQLPFGEVDPSSALLTFPVSIYLIITKRIAKKLQFLYPLIVIIIIYSFAWSPLFNSDTDLINYITSLGILLPPISVIIFFNCYKDLISPIVLNITTFLWFITAFAQQFVPMLVPNDLLSLLISRFSSTVIDDVRGVQSLATEPSSVTYPIILFAFLSIFFYRQEKINLRNLYLNILMIGCVALLSRSFVLFSNLFLLLIFYGLLKLKINFFNPILIIKTFISLVIPLSLSVLTIVLISFLLNYFSPENRVTDFLNTVYDNELFSVQNPIEMIAIIAANLGDLRLIQFLTSYNCLKLFPLGAGVGSFENTFLISWDDIFSGFNNLRTVSRSNSYGGHVASELGFPGFIALLYFHWMYWKVSIRQYEHKIPMYKILAYLMGLSWLYFNSIASIAIPWLMLIFI
ncbi:hypothetical protein HCG51_24570 [Tolypothrix sp. PCC 7910]|uniref:hypothetical protein n=1 Tax=Tolypothrix sp. PCC 7910 TaxID=2099387 RepID=UPI0014277BAC|nr:hypothetical protein [Tolypothrix sp. PCC 7910]QIR39569.1 hypothetical protein HCG51_24570 [Tolypothrix sp. PCC 7910]